MEPLFTWIHRSDLYFGQGDGAPGWNQRRVLAALRDDLAVQGRQHRVHAVFITGDVAFGGKPEQYAAARAWLDDVAGALELPRARVFAVPGNHDVDPEAERDPGIARLMRDLRAGEEAIDTALGHAGERDKLAARLAAYLDFAADLAPACLAQPVPARGERLFWQHRDTHGRLHVRILGLSTALLAAGEQDQGHLALGHEQLALALAEPATPGELVIALSHHHLQAGWLADEDEVTDWLRQRVHVHLFGHVHDALSEEARSGTGIRWLRVATGTAHAAAGNDDVASGFEYAIGTVYAGADGALSVRLWPRRWSAEQGFVVDEDSVPEGEEHVAHRLALVLPADDVAAAAAPARAAATGHGAPKPPPRGLVQRIEPPILPELLDSIRAGREITCPVLIEVGGHPSLNTEYISVMTDRIHQRVQNDSVPAVLLADFAARLFANYGDAQVFLLESRKPDAEPTTLVTVGRSREADIRIRTTSVSGGHAEILFDPMSQEYSIVDRGSRNGTFVNGDILLVEMPHRIASGDRIELGGAGFIFVEPSTLRTLADVMP